MKGVWWIAELREVSILKVLAKDFGEESYLQKTCQLEISILFPHKGNYETVPVCFD